MYTAVQIRKFGSPLKRQARFLKSQEFSAPKDIMRFGAKFICEYDRI